MPIYVIHVSSGDEQRVCDSISKVVPHQLVNECFVPCSEHPFRTGGSWTYVRRPTFPGYVFVDTPNVVELEAALRRVPYFTRALGVGGVCMPLSPDEVAWLQAVTSCGDRTLKMSRGIIKQGQLMILSGPLMGRSAQVRKIDRHKRLAWVEIEMFGRTNIVKLGLEVTQKIA